MAEKEEKPKMSVEMMKTNHDIAAQAALRAQQIMFKHKLAAVTISDNHMSAGIRRTNSFELLISNNPTEFSNKSHLIFH